MRPRRLPAVEQTRLGRGLIHGELATQVGVSAPYASTRLWLDDDRDNIPLGVLERLCQVLDLHPAELFGARPRRRPASAMAAGHDRVATDNSGAATGHDDGVSVATDTGHAPVSMAPITASPVGTTTPDVATLGAAVTALAAPVTHTQLAEALGWSLPRLLTGLEVLEQRLDCVGLRVFAAAAPPGPRSSPPTSSATRFCSTRTHPSTTGGALDHTATDELSVVY